MADSDSDVGKMAGDVAKAELGIGDHVVAPEIKLTPLGEVTKEQIKLSDPFAFMHSERKPGELTPQEKDLGLGAVRAFKWFISALQGEYREKAGNMDYWDFGEEAKVAGDVGMSKEMVEGRYFVHLSTTNMNGKDDWRVSVSSLTVDEEVKDFDSYPARLDRGDLLIGKKAEDAPWEVIYPFSHARGNYGDDAGTELKKCGWVKIGEVRVADFDRHGGFIDKGKKE